MQNQVPGKGLLKVTGILFVIFAGITLLFGLIGLIGSVALGAALGGASGAVLAGALILALVIALVVAVLELIAGIFGIKNCDKPEKSTTCIVFGTIILVLSVISMISSITSGQFQWTSIFGIALPILYFIGAVMNKKAQN